MEVVTGYVEHIVFRNEDNGYTVFNLENEDGETTCVGSFNYINEGEMLELHGEFVNHSVYGSQLKVNSHEVKEPEDLVSIERYLGSGAVKGVGAALAGRIVRKFKEDTFRIIEEEPERLAEVKGISERKAREIAEQVEEKKDMRRAMIYLQKYGISTTLAVKIYKYYGTKLYQVLEENPYQLADNIEGVGFKTADEIASRIGIHTDSDFRIRSGIFYTLQQSTLEGHVYLPQQVLEARAGQLLGVNIQDVEKYIMDLCIEKKTVRKEAEGEIRIYPARYYYLELNTARMLHDLNIDCNMPEDMMEKRLRKVERQEQISLDPMQHRAVIESIKHGLLVLTGGPGTGKTTTINTMIQFFESEGMSILLAAPTGRAAKRMTEATGYEAQTIHRLLEVSGNPEEEGNVNGFMRNRQNPLETDVLIIDEMSMVDLPLMHALLSAVVEGTRLILVGDVNQLPSVGPGSVLKDIIASDSFPVVTLTKIFRQAGESDIVVNAHKINAGEPVVLNNKSRDFFFLKRQEADVIISVVITLIQKKLPRYVDALPTEIQVMTPTRKGLLGVERLNTILQRYLNPPSPEKAEKESGQRLFRVGDKVMQIKNNYQLEWEICTKFGLTVDKGMGVFNGDMGIVKEINSYDESMVVEYDEKRTVKYPFEMLEELELAYAITVHKSQGSEYPAVVIPLLQGPRMLYNRNLLYTAVTRAKKCLTIVGSEATFQEMIQNKNEQNRYTSLAECIRGF
ncbi:ATP-dependent RecD-like DNA helicase [Eubacterium sp. am_0171]|uniref:ATP-dependent RecD2 DNA helicase n=1 Tax=Faecalicatena contorta TaxID=39482 RepID=A0A174F4B7_9FIRM|nr:MULTISPECIES: ATP-dependent RecD-like DNA helicase [Clostridia]MDU7708437.1 ATP-dependent RecD-like DNA helicase [Clostridium sp.]MSC83990.1 ATP-dependent RecD-like DNA helicase [Eubacterium sp. BIOML-A1]MSD06417.1 ATP-dependent RecD-like DNA helicase [Eubacterium sp. BIOML-A2]RYT19902.1 ATP-dependent RecD-like DNA helicase [Eubacterium sp. am_0171]CUO43025.1 Exodeoxyribonuclease V alpha chain [[Eubacterium] contortum] [Faecalicatena contorta]